MKGNYFYELQVVPIVGHKVIRAQSYVPRRKPNLAKKQLLAGSNSEAIQHIMLKLTMDECLNRHYVRTKFRPNP